MNLIKSQMLLGSIALLSFFSGCSSSPESTDAELVPSEIQQAMATAVDKAASKLSGAAKSAYNEALAAAPFPDQDKLLVGQWYGHYQDPSFETHYSYNRRSDGTLDELIVDMDPESKKYFRGNSKRKWYTRGRLLVEQPNDEPEAIDFYLIDDLQSEKFTYRYLDPEVPAEEWLTNVDKPCVGTFPEVPEGWTEIGD